MKFLRCLIIAILAGIWPVHLLAQSAVNRGDLTKILLYEHIGGMDGFYHAAYEIKPAKQNWICVLTSLKSENRFSTKKSVTAVVPQTLRSFSPAEISLFIADVNKPKLYYTAASVGLTAQRLQRQADTLFKKRLSILFPQEKELFKQEITDERIQRLLDAHKRALVMDFYSKYEIKLVSKGHDTVSVASNAFYSPYMLPWVVSNRDTTYQPAISLFFAKAIAGNKYAHYQQMDGSQVPELIYEYIYEQYCRSKTTNSHLRQRFADSFKIIETICHVDSISTSDILSASDPLLFLRLQPKALPPYVIIDAQTHIANLESVSKTLAFCSKVSGLFEQKNFVLDSLAKLGSYKMAYDQSATVRDIWLDHFKSQSGFFANYPNNDVSLVKIYSINRPADFSRWMVFPDGNWMLIDFMGSKAPAFAGRNLKTRPFNGGYTGVLAVFNKKGTIIFQL